MHSVDRLNDSYTHLVNLEGRYLEGLLQNKKYVNIIIMTQTQKEAFDILAMDSYPATQHIDLSVLWQLYPWPATHTLNTYVCSVCSLAALSMASHTLNKTYSIPMICLLSGSSIPALVKRRVRISKTYGYGFLRASWNTPVALGPLVRTMSTNLSIRWAPVTSCWISWQSSTLNTCGGGGGVCDGYECMMLPWLPRSLGSVPVMYGCLMFLPLGTCMYACMLSHSTKGTICVAITGRKRTLFHFLVIILSQECFVEITPDFLCPFMND